jgi:glutathione S-transferase
MALELFWGSGSGPAWRVLLALEVKGVSYQSRLLSFAKGEHRSPEVLALNTRGKVPALRDGAYTIYESLAMITYLDRKHPDPPLFGTTPEDAGTIMRLIMEHECYGGEAISKFAAPLLFSEIAEKSQAVMAALPALREELGRLETALGSRPWLVGETISAADIFVYPGIKTLERALAKPDAETLDHGLRSLAVSFPKLADWMIRVEALPGYAATYPPHWRVRPSIGDAAG